MSERQQPIADALREAGANMSQTDKQAAEAIVQLSRMLSRSQQPQPQQAVDKRHYYKLASAALEAAYRACYDHPARDILGMSHGPFSGVNEALGIVAQLEADNHKLRAELKAAAEIPAPTALDSNVEGHVTPAMIRDMASWCQSEPGLRETLHLAAVALEAALGSPEYAAAEEAQS